MRALTGVIVPLCLAVGVLTLATACSGITPAASPPPGTGTTAPAPSPAAPPKDVPASAPAALSCETLIPSDTVAALQQQGWTALQREFSFGPDVLPGGIECLWGDQSVASDHGLLYAWAPISGGDAAAREAQLVSSGWIREDGTRGVYITADPKASLSTDADGYGMTYLFGPGWVMLSDTKQGLILINPQG